MDHAFWQERWQKGEIGFHAADVQPALVKYWSELGVAKGSTVFVPLCGKSLDMLWLAEQGYRVVGCELSELAIDQFFAERGLTPSMQTKNGFIVKSSGVYELWCGDFFALSPHDLGHVNAVYDRAALVAMPPEMQARYAAKLTDVTPPGAAMLLVGLDYDPREMNGPPFPVPQTRVRQIFEPAFSIELLEARDGLTKSEHMKKRGVTRLEEATYVLRRQT